MLKHFSIDRILQDSTVNQALRYTVGAPPHWLIRRLCIFHDLSYQNVRCLRISDTKEHWVIISHGKPLPFSDEPLLPG